LLSRAIDSVLAQTYKNIEVLVCSDGSSDDTDEVMQAYCQEYPNITFLKNDTPQGACVARNKCINLAAGKYITGLDDDDIFHPRRIELLLANFDEKFACLCSQQYEVDLSTAMPNYLSADLTNDKEEYISLESLLYENNIGNQVFTLTERLKAINGFDEGMPAWQDYDTWVRLLEKFGDAKKIHIKCYYADIDRKRIRISISSNRFKGCQRFYNKHHSLMNLGQIKNGQVRMFIIGGTSMSGFKLFTLFNTKMFKFWIKAWLVKFGLAQ